MAAKSQDKILFGAALVLLLASAGWALLQNSKLAAFRAPVNANVAQSAYVPAGIDAPRVSTRSWPLAPAQSRGAEWIYDVFTPPEIYYDANTKQFSVTPPSVVAVVKAEVPFGLGLVKVKPDAFRLQLVGYVGGEGDYRGTFENAVTGDTIIGRAGKVIADLGLTIKSFEVKRNRIKPEEGMDLFETEATAVVVDNKTGDEIKLTNKSRRISGSPYAVLKPEGDDTLIEHKTGGKFTIGDSTYTVGEVTVEPPSAVVTKESANLTEPVTKTLTPVIPVDAVTVPSGETAPADAPAAPSPFSFGN